MSETVENVEILSRSEALKVSQDPTGKRWLIQSQRGRSLLKAVVEPFNGNTIIPKEFANEWTSRSQLQQAIQSWLHTQWDKSDEKSQKADKPLSKSKSQVKRIAVQTKKDTTSKEDIIKEAVKAENAALEAANKRVTDSNARATSD